MFSGIVEATTPILSSDMQGTCKHVCIRMPRGWKLRAGQSVAIDGICSTVVRAERNFLEVEYMPQTLSKTTAGVFAKGRILNLERSLKMGDVVDGHLLAGHVDARVRIAGMVELPRSKEMIVAAPLSLMKYIALHGSVAVNGVSLTVARRGETSFTVGLIPYTLSHTNLGHLGVGDRVNLEVDILARYVFAALGLGGTVGRHAEKKLRKKR